MSVLTGKRILVTRPRTQAADLCSRLTAEGAEAILFPTVEISALADPAQLDRALESLGAGGYDWVIFTSVNGVKACAGRLVYLAMDVSTLASARIAAIGPATAAELQSLGLKVAFTPPEYVAERIPEGLGDVAGCHILLPRADRARPILAETLMQMGAIVDEVPAYHTHRPPADPAALSALRQGVDVLTFTSSSSLRNFVALAGVDAGSATVACIGPITAQTARDLGLPVHVVAKTYTVPGLVEALKEYFDDQN